MKILYITVILQCLTFNNQLLLSAPLLSPLKYAPLAIKGELWNDIRIWVRILAAVNCQYGELIITLSIDDFNIFFQRSYEGSPELADMVSVLKEHQALLKRQIQIEVGSKFQNNTLSF